MHFDSYCVAGTGRKSAAELRDEVARQYGGAKEEEGKK